MSKKREGKNETLHIVDVAPEFYSTSFHQMVADVMTKKAQVPFATWYDNKGNPTIEYTFGELWEEAGVISHVLRKKWGAQKGHHVVLCYDFGLKFFASFLGCLRAGVIAVLVYPPGPPLKTSLAKMMKVVDDCKPVLILTDSRVHYLKKMDTRNRLSRSRNMWPKSVSWKETDKLSSSLELPKFDEETLTDNDLAFLQYTSGSTGDPKGVMVSFSALAANIKLLHNGFYRSYCEDGRGPNEIVGFSWLPQYHDLGLVFAAISPFAAGWRMHMMSPISFIQNPLIWLELMSRLHVSWGIAPDFAYHLVARKFKEARDRTGGENPIHGLDLSAIHTLQSVAEPIRISTWQEFTQVFTEYHLPDNWFGAGYGLAEHVVGVSWIHECHLSVPRNEDIGPYVACGKTKNFDSSLMIKIVNQNTLVEVSEGETGELWISGNSVARGYYGQKELTEDVFHATLAGDTSDLKFLRTGDLAFFQDGYLYVCGRIKDLIICNGVNYYPQDIEYVVQDSSPAVRPGCSAAFSSDESSGDGMVEIVFEIRKTRQRDAQQVCEAVCSAVATNVGLWPSRVVAIKERTIPKTTSGKIRRRAIRSMLHNNSLDIVNDHHVAMANNIPGKAVHSSCGLAIDLPTEDIPQLAMNAVRVIEADSTNFNHAANTAPPQEQSFEEIICRLLGSSGTVNMRSSWDEIGMSSMLSAHLRDSISDRFSISLPPNCFDLYSTPDELKSYVLSHVGCPFSTELSKLATLDTRPLSWLAIGLLQVLGVASLLFLFAFPIIPAWWAGQLVSEVCAVFTVGGRWMKWIWFPLVIPAWMLSFTLVVIVTKWVVIGRYHEGKMRTPSIAYLRWWYVDRMMHMWEFWVGRFVKDTPILVFVYILLGAQIHPTVQLKAFIREFDLVRIGKGAVIEHKIGCKSFAPWERHEVGPTIRMRSISVGKNSTVQGFLCPGATVGKAAFLCMFSVVPEGAQVPDRVVARGNPAFNAGSVVSRTPSDCYCWQLETLKLIWLVVELYMFFGLLLVGQLMLNDQLPGDWRYTPLCYWFLLIAQSSISSVLTSVILKWILIGKRRPGPYQQTMRRKFSDWAADYHFRVSVMILYPVTLFSRMWTFVLKCHGMDIDIASMGFLDSVVPSKVDLISIKCSFASYVTFETKSEGQYHRTKVTNESTIGRHVRIGPGLTVSGANISPFTDVTTDVLQEEKSNETRSIAFIARNEAYLGLFGIFFIFCILISFIPSYEIWFLVTPSSPFIAVPTLAAALLLATLSALVLLRAIQHAAYMAPEKDEDEAWRGALYFTALTATVCAELWTFSSLFWGTPMFNDLLARLFGAKVEGRMLFLGHRFCDPTSVTFADRTIIDDSIVNGHYGMYKKMVVGPCKVAGVLHSETYAMANTVVKTKESGPLRALIPTETAFGESVSGDEHNQILPVDFTKNIKQDETNDEMFSSCV